MKGEIFEESIETDKCNYKQNMVYRVYYDFTKQIYIPKEERIDKKRGNKREIIDYLVLSHKSGWNITDLYKNLTRNNYYQINTQNLIKNSYFKKIRNENRFKDFDYIKGENILDFGCGYNQYYLTKIINKNVNFLGLDNDINIINSNNKIKLFDYRHSVNDQYEIFNSLLQFYGDEHLKNNFEADTILLLNTIHNVFTKLQYILKFKNNIKFFQSKKKSTRIIIRYLDKDKFNNTFSKDVIDLNGYGFIRKLEENNINVKFNWCHEKYNNEYLVSKTDLINLFDFDNYKIIFDDSNRKRNKKMCIDDDNLMKYFKCFRTLIFENSI